MLPVESLTQWHHPTRARRHIMQKAIEKQTLQQTLWQKCAPARYVTDVINKVFDINTGKSLKYRQLLQHPKYHQIWLHSSANEFGQLAQGVGDRIKGTDMIHFVRTADIPQECWKDITYAKFVCKENQIKRKYNGLGWQWVATASITLVNVEPWQQTCSLWKYYTSTV